MEEKKINITSTAVEKGIDLAKGFLDKLISPTVESTGLLIQEKVTMWRFKNQVKMLNKAKEYCEKHNINPKTISLKLLCPLLEYTALEEDEVMQDKWAILLSNLVDSEQNIQNHVFPYILSQISIEEFSFLDAEYRRKYEKINSLKQETETLKLQIDNIENSNIIVEARKKHNEKIISYSELYDIEQPLYKLKNQYSALLSEINSDFLIIGIEIEEYQIYNLIRLGLIKIKPNSYGYIGEHSIKNTHSEHLYLHDAEVKIESDIDDYMITALCEIFVLACTEKSKINLK